jgi:hypothetical protein
MTCRYYGALGESKEATAVAIPPASPTADRNLLRKGAIISGYP